MNSSKLSTILRPRAKFAITNYDLLYVSLLCFLYLLQVKLYNSELSSIMIYVFDECDASCPYSFIDSSLHKPEVMFIELSFAWGQAKSKLGGSWYVHFASLFYVLIHYYSLIYFVLRGDTYVISSVFAWLMTFGAWTAAVRILMEKVLFGGKIREDQKIRENIRKILFFQKTKDARRCSGDGPQGAHTTP